MASFASADRKGQEQFGGGVAGAVALHLALAGALLGAALIKGRQHPTWGEQTSSVGAIQASLVSALPLPPRAVPVEKQVLASEDTNPAPKPPPKEATAPPPRPTDLLIKARTDKKPPLKTAPVPTPEPPKHPQPTPPTPRADTGESSTQLPQSVSQFRNGTSTITVEDRTFGARYAYYVRAMERTIAEQYYQQDIDARSAQSKTVMVSFDIQHDGTLDNIHVVNRSGSPSLDTAALRALQRIDTFGTLPAGDHVTVQWVFGFHLQ